MQAPAFQLRLCLSLSARDDSQCTGLISMLLHNPDQTDGKAMSILRVMAFKVQGAHAHCMLCGFAAAEHTYIWLGSSESLPQMLHVKLNPQQARHEAFALASMPGDIARKLPFPSC